MTRLGRQPLIGLLAAALLAVCCWPVWGAAQADAPAAVTAPAVELYRYDIAFLWFDRLAEAELSLSRDAESGRWRARVEARTLGVAAWLTRDRVQRYASLMALTADGALRSLQHDADILKTKGGQRRSRLKRYLFDHRQGQIVRKVIRNGIERPAQILPMPEAEPNDILTAFYNFRRGLFGPLREGGRYRIPTYSRKGGGEIRVDVLSAKGRPRSPRFPAGGMLLKVQVDKEIFDTDDGTLYLWLDQQGRPAQVVVQDVIGLGDVRCTLRSEGEES